MNSRKYQRLRQRKLGMGEIIFREGDQGDFAYIIEEGEVEIWRSQNDLRRVINIRRCSP